MIADSSEWVRRVNDTAEVVLCRSPNKPEDFVPALRHGDIIVHEWLVDEWDDDGRIYFVSEDVHKAEADRKDIVLAVTDRTDLFIDIDVADLIASFLTSVKKAVLCHSLVDSEPTIRGHITCKIEDPLSFYADLTSHKCIGNIVDGMEGGEEWAGGFDVIELAHSTHLARSDGRYGSRADWGGGTLIEYI